MANIGAADLPLEVLVVLICFENLSDKNYKIIQVSKIIGVGLTLKEKWSKTYIENKGPIFLKILKNPIFCDAIYIFLQLLKFTAKHNNYFSPYSTPKFNVTPTNYSHFC